MPAIAKKERRERNIVALCAMPKAAPELVVNCSCKKEPRIGFGFTPNVCKASTFEPLSIAIIAMASASKDLTAFLWGAELISAVPLSVYMPYRELHVGRLADALYQLRCRTLRTVHTS